MAGLLGLAPVGPVESSDQQMTRITVYSPPEDGDRIISAMAAVGAGRIGVYERCAFSGPGRGEFTPRPGSHPIQIPRLPALLDPHPDPSPRSHRDRRH